MKQKFLTIRRVMLTALSALLVLCLAVGIVLSIPINADTANAEEVVDADTWDGDLAAAGWGGTDVEAPEGYILSDGAKTLLLDSAAAFAYFAHEVYVGAYGGFKDYTVTLECNVDLNDELWLPIGTTSRGGAKFTGEGINAFLGTFDGNGNTIYNFSSEKFYEGVAYEDEKLVIKSGDLTLPFDVDGNEFVYGLFGATGNVTIENLNVKGVKIDLASKAVDGYSENIIPVAVGALVGYNAGNITVRGCTVGGAGDYMRSVTAVGGLVGSVNAGLENGEPFGQFEKGHFVENTLRAVSSSVFLNGVLQSRYSLGSIVLEGCTNYANLGGVADGGAEVKCGGMLGLGNYFETLHLINCENCGEVDGAWSGGMTGALPLLTARGTSDLGIFDGEEERTVNYDILFENCENSGAISGALAGGMVAANSVGGEYDDYFGENTSESIKFINCKNGGEITATKLADGVGYAGGIAGNMVVRTCAELKVESCFNSGNVSLSGAVISDANAAAGALIGNLKVFDGDDKHLMDSVVMGLANGGTLNGGSVSYPESAAPHHMMNFSEYSDEYTFDNIAETPIVDRVYTISDDFISTYNTEYITETLKPYVNTLCDEVSRDTTLRPYYDRYYLIAKWLASGTTDSNNNGFIKDTDAQRVMATLNLSRNDWLPDFYLDAEGNNNGLMAYYYKQKLERLINLNEELENSNEIDLSSLRETAVSVKGVNVGAIDGVKEDGYAGLIGWTQGTRAAWNKATGELTFAALANAATGEYKQIGAQKAGGDIDELGEENLAIADGVLYGLRESASGLFSIEIPAGVTKIADFAFFGDINLVGITFAGNEKARSGGLEIGDYAFMGTSVTKLEIPERVVCVGAMAFGAASELNYVILPENAESMEIDGAAFGADTYVIATGKQQYDALKDILTDCKLTYLVTIRYNSGENTVDKEMRLFGASYGVRYDEETDKWLAHAESELTLGTEITRGLRWYKDGDAKKTALTVSGMTALLQADDCGEYIDLVAFDTGVKAFIAKDDIVYDGAEHKLTELNSLLHRMSDKITDGMEVSIIGFNGSDESLPDCIKDVGTYTIFVADGNAEYTFTLNVNRATIGSAEFGDWKVVTNTESSELNSYSLYIYTYKNPSGSGEYYPSIETLSADRIQALGLNDAYTTRTVTGSVVRNHNKNVTVELSGSDKFEVVKYDGIATAKNVGVYTASVTLRANANYRFLESYSRDINQGLEATVNKDGTVTVTKVWYIVNLSNWLVDFSVPDFAYGADVTITNPTPYYVDYQGNTEISVTLALRNLPLVSAVNIREHPLGYYINGAMPAGTYTLTVTVGGVYVQEHVDHTDEVHADHTNCPVVWHSGITETYTFTVAKASLPSTQLNALNTALKGQTFTYVADGSSHLYGSAAASAVNAMLNARATVNRTGTFWASADKDSYYGGFAIDYNLLRMHSDAYSADVVTDEVGLYTVYYRIYAPNYYSSVENLAATEKRQDYFFNVINVGQVAKPSAIGHKIYTGSALTADVPYSSLYEVVANEGGVDAGTYPVTLALTQPEYYMWEGQALADRTETCEIDFVIDKADNDWVVSPAVIAWKYNDYDVDTNLIMGAVVGGEVSFAISADEEGESLVEGLENITLTKKADAEYYVVSDDVTKLLSALDAATYYLIATVSPDVNHNGIAAQTVPFTVSKALNDWKAALGVTPWQYGRFDAATNLIMGETVYGDVSFVISDTAGVVKVASFAAVTAEVAAELNALDAGDYRITATVSVDNNHESLTAQTVAFTVAKAANDWKTALGVIAWQYGKFDADTNLIMGETVYGDVSFVISDTAGTIKVESFDAVTAEVAAKLNALDAGDYRITATVNVGGNYGALTAQSVAFTVAKAANDWKTALDVIAWQYGEYDANVNRILAATEYGTIKFTIMQGATVIAENFDEINDELAEKLRALLVGDYTLTAKVTVDNNHAALQDAVVTFKITPLNNDWVVSPSVIQWQFGGYDRETHLILGTAKQGEIVFRITDKNDNALTDEFTLTDGKVPANVAAVLSRLTKGDYKLWADVTQSGNYSELSATAQFSVNRAVNTWEQTLGITPWMEGKFNSEENIIEVKAKFGDVIIKIVDSTDTEQEPYYEGALGTDELNEVLSGLKVGTYLLTATVTGNADYSDLVSESVLFKVFERPGLAWWAWLLIIVGILGVIAIIFWILHEKGVLQMLTSRFLIQMRTKMTVDATIAAVRANLVAEQSRKTIAEAEEREKLEAMKKAAEEEAAKSAGESEAGEQAASETAAEESEETVEEDKRETDGNDTSGNDTPDEN